VSSGGERAQQTGAAANDRVTLEARLPQMLDETLSRLSQVGVERILALAAALAEARAAAPATAHLDPGECGRN